MPPQKLDPKIRSNGNRVDKAAGSSASQYQGIRIRVEVGTGDQTTNRRGPNVTRVKFLRLSSRMHPKHKLHSIEVAQSSAAACPGYLHRAGQLPQSALKCKTPMQTRMSGIRRIGICSTSGLRPGCDSYLQKSDLFAVSAHSGVLREAPEFKCSVLMEQSSCCMGFLQSTLPRICSLQGGVEYERRVG